MKLSISNIAWLKEDDDKVYKWMSELGYTGLEVAPTRIFSETPYEKNTQASIWRNELKLKYGFDISSIQSIYYQRPEQIFASNEEFWFLLNYTAKAIDFASSIDAKNIVFGCAKNRNLLRDEDYNLGLFFFRQIADYAYSKNTTIGLEAISKSYNTNYITDTKSAIDLITTVDSKGLMLNLDTGTMLYNNESIKVLDNNINLISHVHISEPGLQPLQKREFYSELYSYLKSNGYNKYVSLEIAKPTNISVLRQSMEYMAEIFNK